ncbi:MAG: undecaprenyldiphospho-muramoylpentapeptide beta-N-acetylglucosaminyltransferase [Oscillospiraceae bacterium]|nr:undecaprenyldiphospho-muramoylpentapeptide beta-N-acetylglucosaminyltransferase [Oscillospiraceae bacterium]
MNVIFTCGGTGGHINPAIAVANAWKTRHPDSNILFIGAVGEMEEQLVPKAGYTLKTLPGAGLSRSLSLAGIKKNCMVVRQLMDSVKQCKKIISEFGADIVVGTGGYASMPALLAAAMLKIPTCVHESNAVPGLTTRMAARWARRILVCFPQSVQHYKKQDKVQVVGMPVRSEFIYNKKSECREKLGLDSRPVILSAFGSQGAKAMNEMTAELLRLEREAGYPYQHIHAVGSYGWDWMPRLVAEKGVEVKEDGPIYLKEYLYDMPTAMVAADLVIGRAGASSCNEVAVAGVPCILIPSPNVTANHQEKNAMALVDQGAAAVILEKDCTAEVVMAKIRELLEDRKAYEAMRKGLLSIAVPDCAERICAIMEELISGECRK